MFSLTAIGHHLDLHNLVAISLSFEYGTSSWLKALGCENGLAKRYALTESLRNTTNLSIVYRQERSDSNIACIQSVIEELRTYLAKGVGAVPRDDDRDSRAPAITAINVVIDGKEKACINDIGMMPQFSIRLIVREKGDAIILAHGCSRDTDPYQVLLKEELQRSCTTDLVLKTA